VPAFADLRFAFTATGVGTRVEIEMHTVLHDLVVGTRHEADADASIVGRTHDDLPLAFGQYGPAEHLAPEAGQPRRSWASMTTWWRDTGTASSCYGGVRPAHEPAIPDAARRLIRRCIRMPPTA